MSKILNIKIDDDLKEKLDFLCKKERRNKSNMLNYLIEYYYNNQVVNGSDSKIIKKYVTPKDYE